MAVAPPPGWGAIPTQPRKNGGNMDNKELVAGTTLYLPVHVDGALFSCGDGHGVQGDGEGLRHRIETGLIGTFELIVRPDMKLEWPMAETPTHIMTMGFDPDLDDCVVIALRDMIKLICARTNLSREDAYTLAAWLPICASPKWSTAPKASMSCWRRTSCARSAKFHSPGKGCGVTCDILACPRRAEYNCRAD